MDVTGWVVFETALGACGLGWSAAGVAGVQLPEASPAATRLRCARRWRQAPESGPTGAIARAVEDIIALLSGEPVDLSLVPVDFDGIPAFDQGVYRQARTIPAGATRTYGEIAEALGDPGAARAVGTALARNPIAIVVPCHRVVAAGGRVGGFSAGGGLETKRRLLAIESIRTFRLTPPPAPARRSR